MCCFILPVSLLSSECNIRNDALRGHSCHIEGRGRGTLYEAECWCNAKGGVGCECHLQCHRSDVEMTKQCNGLDSLFIHSFGYLFVVKADDRYLPRIIMNNCL